MHKSWQIFKAFWNAEEVPRWFGLSLVLIYLGGLGAIAYWGIHQIRTDAYTQLEHLEDYAVTALAQRLEAIDTSTMSKQKVQGTYEQELYEFAARIPTRFLRVLDRKRHIVASSNEAEVGEVASVTAVFPPGVSHTAGMPVQAKGQDFPDRFFRIRLSLRPAAEAVPQATATDQVPADPADSSLYLEACILPAGQQESTLVAHADNAVIILIVMGALLVLYRCLRAQLRGVSEIAGRLRSRARGVQTDLTALKMADSIDCVTESWNELVDFAQHLSEEAQRHHANDELTRVLARASGGALSEVLHALPDGILYITEEDRFDYANAAACHLLGWTMEELKQESLANAESSGIGGKILDLLRSSLQADGSFAARTEVVEMDDAQSSSESSYRVSVIPLHRDHHRGECMTVVRDISQQLRADRAREDFVTQVTHELRTPLTNIRAYAETLSSGMFDDPSVITDCYNVITKETRRLSRLIEDILSVSQLEVGGISLVMDTVDLKTLLEDGVRDVRGLADEKNIDIQLVLPAKMEPIRADRDKLAVIINNMLGNAIKYTPAQGDVVIGCQVTSDAVVIMFKDNGIGVAPEDQARIFEKFQRANDPAVESEPGTGIGLFTSREIARRHGGDIELISQKGEGSTFRVRLPHRESRATIQSTSEEA